MMFYWRRNQFNQNRGISMSRLGQLRYRFGQFNIAEKLILINILCFVLPFFFRTLFFLFNLPQFSWLSYFELSSDISTLVFRPWTLLSYGFFHGGIGHILWNMLLLYYAAQIFLNLFLLNASSMSSLWGF